MAQYDFLTEDAKCLRGLPVEKCGVMLYPAKMERFEDFTACKEAFTLRLGTLPVKYAIKEYLDATFSFDNDLLQKGEKVSGLFMKAVTMLLIATRQNYDGKPISDYIDLKGNANGDVAVDCIKLWQDGKIVKITPHQYSVYLRPTIAKQNGLKLPDESQNIDLIRANEERQELKQGNQKLDLNLHDLVASVAYQSNVRENDIWQWTVREFEARKRAIDREKRYMLYGQAELSGFVSFKKGNPAPSWCYDAIDDSLGTMSLKELTNTVGGAVKINDNKE